MEKLTPLMQQYWDIKNQHTDKILLFRMGDFYEMFFDDAVKAAPILNIALTSRNKSQGQDVPMCGVPHHAVGPQVNKLLDQGFKVAICDQIEDPKDAKTIVKRAVTRIVTPGMVYDPDTIDSASNNFVAAGVMRNGSFNLAAIDVSTGEAINSDNLTEDEASAWLERISPKELVVERRDLLPIDALFTIRPTWPGESATEYLFRYVVETQGPEIQQVLRPSERLDLEGLYLSPTALRSLEIFKSVENDDVGSLLFSVNLTKTPMGSRLLKKRLMNPWTQKDRIQSELDQVAAWIEDGGRKHVRSVASQIGDIERRVAKLSSPLCNARDLVTLARSLELACSVVRNQQVSDVAADILNTLKTEDLPVSVREGGIIKKGIEPRLDDLVELATNAQTKLSELELRERTSTGIQSLKIKYSSVFGYSFEVTKPNLDKVPQYFIRRQTLAQAERFVTADLSELEEKILSSQQKRCDMEFEIFSALRRRVLTRARDLLQFADKIAELDLRTALAELAVVKNFCRPEFNTDRIELVESRHPVLENNPCEIFIPNDIVLKKGECLLLTGPNMAGKSTLMRQVALTAILAQIGSYVPAGKAFIPIFDSVFTRIGASDNISQGLSTFMVEMTETAEIIQNASDCSLVILDEIGRGTSTYDGMSLAQAVLEYFVDEVKCFTFFATHYHELTACAQTRAKVINAHMAIQESKGQLVFLRKLLKGPASRSYGIEVARLAGLPNGVTLRAQTILKGLGIQAKALGKKQMSFDL